MFCTRCVLCCLSWEKNPPFPSPLGGKTVVKSPVSGLLKMWKSWKNGTEISIFVIVSINWYRKEERRERKEEKERWEGAGRETGGGRRKEMDSSHTCAGHEVAVFGIHLSPIAFHFLKCFCLPTNLSTCLETEFQRVWITYWMTWLINAGTMIRDSSLVPVFNSVLLEI